MSVAIHTVDLGPDEAAFFISLFFISLFFNLCVQCNKTVPEKQKQNLWDAI